MGAEEEVVIKVEKNGTMRIKIRYLNINTMIVVTQNRENSLIWPQVLFLMAFSMERITNASMDQSLHS